MFLVLSACTFTVTSPLPPLEVETETAPVELVRDDEPWRLATSGREVSSRQVDDELLAAWIDADRVVALRVPSSDPAGTDPVVMGTVSAEAGRPDVGSAEGRLIVAWDDGQGALSVGGVLDSGELQTPLVVVEDGVVSGTVVLDLAVDGAGTVGYSAGRSWRGSAFDRQLTVAEPEPAWVTLDIPDAVDAVAEPDGGFAIVWHGPTLTDTGEDPFIGLRAARFPVDAEPTDATVETVESEQRGPAAIAVRDDGALAVAWIGLGAGTDPTSVWVRTVEPSGEVASPVRVASGTDLDDTSVTWAGSLVVVGWSGTRDEGDPEVALGVVEETGEVAISWFQLSASPFDAHRSPSITSRAVNGGHRITALWEVGPEPELWGGGRPDRAVTR